MRARASAAPSDCAGGTLVPVRAGTCLAYTRHVGLRTTGQAVPDHSPEQDPAPAGTSNDIRRRTVRVLAVEFVMLMGVAAIQGFWPGGGPGQGLAVVFLAASAVVVPIVMARLVEPILRDIHRLEEDRARLVDLYGRAREDSLLDGLTGLGNHRAFQEELSRQLELASRHGSMLALLLIDVDDLKTVNDERGHAHGDELLAGLGRIAMNAIRRGDRAFRVGGDEFALILPNADIETGLVVARRMLASALNGGYADGGPVEPFSLSIGVSAYPAPSTFGDLIYRHADAALYWCKRHGRTNAVAYDPGRHGVSSDDRSIEDVSAAIGTILAEKLLRPVYQPIFSMTSGEVIGFEGLIRPTDGAPMADASSLFAAAERADRTVELDMACLQVVADGIHGLEPGVYLSINLSPRTLESDQFHPVELTAIFGRRGIKPEQLVIELTEREEVQDLQQLATQRGGVPAGRDAPRGRRRGCRERGAPAPQRDPLRHRQGRPVTGPGRHPPRPVPRRPARIAGAGGALDRAHRRGGRRDERAALRGPRARHHRRPGVPARPPGTRAARGDPRPRGAHAQGVGRGVGRGGSRTRSLTRATRAAGSPPARSTHTSHCRERRRAPFREVV